MATLGELVATAAGRMPKPNITLRNIQEAARFLRLLGLWDAEVLEGDVGEASNGVLAIWPGGYHEKPWWDAGIVPGQSVRIIVLKGEE